MTRRTERRRRQRKRIKQTQGGRLAVVVNRIVEEKGPAAAAKVLAVVSLRCARAAGQTPETWVETCKLVSLDPRIGAG